MFPSFRKHDRDEAGMHFQFNVASPATATTASSDCPPPTTDLAELLRGILEAQHEQIRLLRHQVAAHDTGGKWRSFLERWKEDFGTLPAACKKALPHLERAYMTLISDLAAHLDEQGEDTTTNEFALSEFLDRFGVRLNQLGTILSLVGPLAEIAGPAEQKK
jgi:hypothetical protein